MEIKLRTGTPADANICAEICFDAFTTISRQHNFAPDFPSGEVVTGFMNMLLARPDVYSVVAEADGKVIGSNFLWEGDAIAGVGPITVATTAQNVSVGRRLMEDVLNRAAKKNKPGVRLVQTAFHNRSLSLYAKLGFDVREPLTVLQGPALRQSIAGFPVRPATENDLDACNRLCGKIHGHDRKGELRIALWQKSATVVERNGRITGYSTVIGFFGHSVAESNDDLKALIAAAPEIAGPGFLLPSRNSEVFRWCLNNGFRVSQPMTLMSVGLYNEPSGAFLPSILY